MDVGELAVDLERLLNRSFRFGIKHLPRSRGHRTRGGRRRMRAQRSPGHIPWVERNSLLRVSEPFCCRLSRMVVASQIELVSLGVVDLASCQPSFIRRTQLAAKRSGNLAGDLLANVDDSFHRTLVLIVPKLRGNPFFAPLWDDPRCAPAMRDSGIPAPRWQARTG